MLNRQDLNSNDVLFGEDGDEIEQGENITVIPVEGENESVDDNDVEEEEVEECDFPDDDADKNINNVACENNDVDDTDDDMSLDVDDAPQPTLDQPTNAVVDGNIVVDDEIVQVPDSMTEEEIDTTLKATTVIHIGVAKVLEKLRIISTEEYVSVVNSKIEDEYNALTEDGSEGVLEALDKENTPTITIEPTVEFTYEPLDVTEEGEVSTEIGESCKSKVRTIAEVQTQMKNATTPKAEEPGNKDVDCDKE